MDWSSAVHAWLAVLRVAGRGDGTIELRAYHLSRLARDLSAVPLAQVTHTDLVNWLAAQGWAQNTRRSWWTTLNGWFGWLHSAGELPANPMAMVPAVSEAIPDPRPTPEDEYRSALARADTRTRLMIRLAADLGLRRAEVAGLHSHDVERDLYGWTLRVMGKGRKVRRVPLPADLAAALREADGWVFPSRVDGHDHLSPDRVGRLVSDVFPRAWTMHNLRHRFGTAAYSIDRDLFTVQDLLGHASPVTTRRYVKLPSDSARRTVAAVARL